MNNIKKIRNLISVIKKEKPTREEIRSFASDFIEIMAESGIPPKTRSEFYQYCQEPSANLDKLIDLAEDTLTEIEK